MRLQPRLFLAALSLLAFSSSTMPAASAAGNDAVIERLRAEAPGVRVRYSEGHRAPTGLEGLELGPYAGGPAEAARGFLEEWQGLLPAPLTEMRVRRVIPLGRDRGDGYGRFGASVRLEQVRNGIPVVGDVAVVVLEPDGRVRAFRQQAVRGAELEPVVVDRDAAIEIARRHQPFRTVRAARLALLPMGEEARLAWEIYPAAPAGTAQWVIRISASTGALLGLEDRRSHAGPQARAYPNNPYVDPAPVTVELSEAAADGLADPLMQMHNCIDQGDREPIPATDGETYQAHVCTEMPAPGPTDGNYLYDPVPYPEDTSRDEDLFAAPQLYYHITRVNGYFQGLGMGALEAAPLHVVTNVRQPDASSVEVLQDPEGRLEPYDNAYFLGPYQDGSGEQIPGQLVFGQGDESDFAYDTDVVYHEFTHAVVHTVIGLYSGLLDGYGGSVEPAALNEAFADYFSSAMQGDPHVGEYAGLAWDPEGGGIRGLEGDAQCPGNLQGQQHNDSQPFGQALWSIRGGLGGEDPAEVDQVFFNALAGLLPSSTLSLAAGVVVTELEETFGATGASVATAEFAAHGVLGCERVIPVTPAGLDAPVLDFTGLYGTANFGSKDPVPGNLQLSFEVPEGRHRVKIRFFQAQYRGVPLQAFNYDTAPQPVKVYENYDKQHLYTYQSYASGLRINADPQRTLEAVETGELEQGATRDYPQYEVSYLVQDQPGVHYLQLVNAGEIYTPIYELSIDVTEEPEEEDGCGCSGAGPARGTPVHLAWLVFTALLPRLRRKVRR